MKLGSQFHTTGKTALSNHQAEGRVGPGASTNTVNKKLSAPAGKRTSVP